MRPGGHGTAGELVGSFDAADRIGAIERNGLFGIFGTLDAPPDGTPVETAPASAVKTGSATILSTVAGDTVQAYAVNITRVYHDGASTRFAITVTDPALLSATGGIVQGMSGSPILQDGRLVGAVTHVLLSDPAKGYGVSIDDMLAAAQEQASKFDASYIQVWGQAEKEITPDEFYLSVTINEKDSKGKISIQTQERAMLDALKKLGVDTQKQLRVVDMSSEYFKKGNALAWKQFQLKLNTPEQVAQVFGSLNDLGISNVSMEKVTHSQLDQYKNEVRIAAMKSAQTNAQTLAGAIGQKAGKCFYIYDSNNDVVPYYGNVFMARSMKAAVANDAAEAAGEAAGLDFKTIKLKYSIQAKFVLE